MLKPRRSESKASSANACFLPAKFGGKLGAEIFCFEHPWRISTSPSWL